MRKQPWIIGAAAALVLVVVGAGVVMAQTPDSGSSSGTTFLDRVAQKLGIDTPRLRDAVTSARNDQIDEAVKNGDLTQKQADNLKNKIQNEPDEGFGDRGFGRGKGFGFGFPGKFGLGLEDGGQKLADFLGVSTDQLMTELRADNATLASVAAAHGKSRDDLKTFITSNAKSALDAKVQSSDLTQKQADEALSNLNSRLDGLIDSKFGLGKHGGGFRFGGPPHDGAEPGTTPATPNQSGSFSSIFSS